MIANDPKLEKEEIVNLVSAVEMVSEFTEDENRKCAEILQNFVGVYNKDSGSDLVESIKA